MFRDGSDDVALPKPLPIVFARRVLIGGTRGFAGRVRGTTAERTSREPDRLLLEVDGIDGPSGGLPSESLGF
jgi:hypothetical protein